jgi:hypothetical protein
MIRIKLFAAAVIVAAVTVAPTFAQARHHHRHHAYRDYNYGLPYPISYLHNYGPGVEAGTFAYYDGPSSNHCYQGSAAYIGQDHQRHPCF